MKHVIFIYQDPPSFGRRVIISAGMFTGISKTDKFIEKLNEKLSNLDKKIIVEKDDTEADLKEIASHNYDSVTGVPGLQKKIYAKDQLPPIFYLDLLDYHNLLVSKTIDEIKRTLL